MQTTKQKKKSHLSFRLNVLFSIVFLLFSGLIFRLGFVQIVQGDEFVNELESISQATARSDAPRGVMFDRFGNSVVDNQLELSVTYTNPSYGTRAETMIEIARDLEPLLDMEDKVERITPRDRRDYILANMTIDERYDLVSKEERSKLESSTDEYQLEIERITDQQIEDLSDQHLQILAIYREMTRGYANTPQTIKQQITEKEAHVISENLDRLPGIDITRGRVEHTHMGIHLKAFLELSMRSLVRRLITIYHVVTIVLM